MLYFATHEYMFCVNIIAYRREGPNHDGIFIRSKFPILFQLSSSLSVTRHCLIITLSFINFCFDFDFIILLEYLSFKQIDIVNQRTAIKTEFWIFKLSEIKFMQMKLEPQKRTICNWPCWQLIIYGIIYYKFSQY